MIQSGYYALVAAACLLIACSAPTSPDGCDDTSGQMPAPLLRIECTPAGADLQCRAVNQQSGQCASPDDDDVTSDARWFSSDTSVGFFSRPGAFQTRSSGQVRIHAEYSLFLRSEAQAFAVAPGQTPERLASIVIGVRDAVTRTFLTDAKVDLVPARGDAQTCRTDAEGQCRVWTFLSPVRVIVTKTGYARVERTFEPLDTCYCAGELIVLSPLR